MKANNLLGDYCQTCASILDEAQRNFRPVIVLDSQCAAVYHQTGDASRFNVPTPQTEAKPQPARREEKPIRIEPEAPKAVKKKRR